VRRIHREVLLAPCETGVAEVVRARIERPAGACLLHVDLGGATLHTTTTNAADAWLLRWLQ